MKKFIFICLILLCATIVWGQSTYNARQTRTTQEIKSVVSGVILSDTDYGKIVSIGVSGGTNTITLPSNPFDGASFVFEVSGNGTVRLIPPATTTIDNGGAGQYLYTNGVATNKSVTLQYDKTNSNWGVRSPLGSWKTTSTGDVDKRIISGGLPIIVDNSGNITIASKLLVGVPIGIDPAYYSIFSNLATANNVLFKTDTINGYVYLQLSTKDASGNSPTIFLEMDDFATGGFPQGRISATNGLHLGGDILQSDVIIDSNRNVTVVDGFLDSHNGFKTNGVVGHNATIVVKGSTGADCNIVVSKGIITSTTCP